MQEVDISLAFPRSIQGWLLMASLRGDEVQVREQQAAFKPGLGGTTARESFSNVEAKKTAFATFLMERQDRLLGMAYRILRDREAALDVLQEVALTLFQRWEDLDQQKNVEGWLYRVMVHACYRWLRSQPAFVEVELVESHAHTGARTPQEAHLRTLQFQSFLAKALECLTEQERLAFLLRDIEQRPGKEIAVLMDCQGTTVRGYYFSARKKLAAYIERYAPEWLSLLGQGEAQR
ncbi:MAG: sigma-70 family RNA polymerase sigma factor [Myxococcales bacterium]|nr:sigma-70 family RNA polymerase sigma factor [Myxococcales bacterium]MCB9641701.1 sigma-70 family RNA polymerase sigma factor [Myxococcales bacterium]